MDSWINNLNQLYLTSNTWAKALALVGTFLTLYLLNKLRELKKAQNVEDTKRQRALDQATNRTDNQDVEDKFKEGADKVNKALEDLDKESGDGNN